MTDITKLLKIRDEQKEVDAKIKVLEEESKALAKKLREICTHPTTVEKSSYFPGGYDDKSYTTYWTVCTICAASSDPVDDCTGGSYA